MNKIKKLLPSVSVIFFVAAFFLGTANSQHQSILKIANASKQTYKQYLLPCPVGSTGIQKVCYAGTDSTCVNYADCVFDK